MKYFTKFQSDYSQFIVPESFTFPFNYEPNPLAVLATTELQTHIRLEIESQHNFGHNQEPEGLGKMFGVLVVRSEKGELGYLAAFSGKLGGKNEYEKFVPPVYDMLSEESFYKAEEAKIFLINNEVDTLEANPDLIQSQEKFLNLIQASKSEIEQLKKLYKEEREARKYKRTKSKIELTEKEFESFSKELDRESAMQHYHLKDTIKSWDDKLSKEKLALELKLKKIKELKLKRKQMSKDLQNRLFDSYKFLNAKSESKTLRDIFIVSDDELPPSGAGECAAPKLLHFAYSKRLKPIALAEFWWGKSPNSEIRKHAHFYPSCKTKCIPILGHMLLGLKVDPNPLIENQIKIGVIEIIFEDDYLIVVNKPHDFLSVPGRNIEDSVFTRMKKKYPNLDDLRAVHRLDMSTSGLMLIAKTKKIHKLLQLQFLHRTIKKKYIAILDGIIENKKGTINLPLKVDFENRPRQMVCFENGKSSITEYEVVEINNDKTRVHLYPLTGRTHQLRIHMSHHLGLNIPILGDDLYGKRKDRLYLHAEALSFTHPITQERIELEIKADF